MSRMNPVDYIGATLRAILEVHPQSGIEALTCRHASEVELTESERRRPTRKQARTR